jgi:hypothetical protein
VEEEIARKDLPYSPKEEQQKRKENKKGKKEDGLEGPSTKEDSPFDKEKESKSECEKGK